MPKYYDVIVKYGWFFHMYFYGLEEDVIQRASVFKIVNIREIDKSLIPVQETITTVYTKGKLN